MGGATAGIGDPSGKSEMRKMLTREEINKNVESIKNSLSVFLDFNGDNPAEIVNNADWFDNINYLDFMREYGVHFNINKMLSNEIYAKRLESGGLTLFELGYMPMQAYDFIHLNKTKGCTIQYGGADQWGNIVAGVELQRKLNFLNGTNVELIAATNPLLLTPEGKKMGKTEKGAIWIDKDKISAYDFYQGVYQTPDACVEMMFALFTDLPMDEIKKMCNDNIVNAKQRLSYELTKFVRGEKDAILAENTAKELFAGSGQDKNMPTTEIKEENLKDGCVGILELLTLCNLTKSNGEARRLIEQGGITLNDEKVLDSKLFINKDSLEKGVILKKGKKQFNKAIFKV